MAAIVHAIAPVSTQHRTRVVIMAPSGIQAVLQERVVGLDLIESSFASPPPKRVVSGRGANAGSTPVPIR